MTGIKTSNPIKPFAIRDFSKGRITKYSVSPALIPQNSVSESININFDTVIGSAVVRTGTTLIGTVVASNKVPLGLSNYVSSKGTSYNNIIAVFTGAATSTLYYYDTQWRASDQTTMSNTAKVRFAMLGNQMFMVNGAVAMKSSSNGGATWGTVNSIDSGGTIKPSLILRTTARLLASGDTSTSPSRVFFSSIVDPTTTPGTITWNTTNLTGDYIDINPDDGDTITAMAETSSQVLVFKKNGVYRLNVVSKNTDVQNIFNIGTPSQECVVSCQGLLYFFSGIDIRRTDGTYPVQISRIGVQDFIDAIPQASWANVGAGTDGWNVYFSIGDITLNTNKDEQKSYSNVVLKFSTRDETWSVHSYAQQSRFYSQYTATSNATKMISADTSGSVQYINVGTTDNTTPIYFSLETQEIECGNRAHKKTISDDIGIFTDNGIDTIFQVKNGEDHFSDVNIRLSERVNVGQMTRTEGHFQTFRWYGESSSTAPVFEGFYIEAVSDDGLVQ